MSVDMFEVPGDRLRELTEAANQPNLGRATTRQLLEELKARFQVNHLKNAEDAAQWLLDGLNETNLRYRTVDH
jgi:hypothetical protein